MRLAHTEWGHSVNSHSPIGLLWVDTETTGVPTGNDWSDVHLLEIGVIVTDFSLNTLCGYREVVKMTQAGADAIRKTPQVREMHQTNGLLKESISSTHTVADIEQGIIQLLKEETTFNPGDLIIAGSGVAAFDHPLLKEKMPELAKWLVYYPFDIGVFRRVSKILAGGAVVNPALSSFDGPKTHRAWDDILMHLREAKQFQQWINQVTQQG